MRSLITQSTICTNFENYFLNKKSCHTIYMFILLLFIVQFTNTYMLRWSLNLFCKKLIILHTTVCRKNIHTIQFFCCTSPYGKLGMKIFELSKNVLAIKLCRAFEIFLSECKSFLEILSMRNSYTKIITSTQMKN